MTFWLYFTLKGVTFSSRNEKEHYYEKEAILFPTNLFPMLCFINEKKRIKKCGGGIVFKIKYMTYKVVYHFLTFYFVIKIQYNPLINAISRHYFQTFSSIVKFHTMTLSSLIISRIIGNFSNMHKVNNNKLS